MDRPLVFVIVSGSGNNDYIEAKYASIDENNLIFLDGTKRYFVGKGSGIWILFS